MTTKEVSKQTGYCFSFCSRWAKEHNLDRVMIKGIWAYNWTDEDVSNFEARRNEEKLSRNSK